jgi:glycosyltransferase involved in cell wall biosynthesis
VVNNQLISIVLPTYNGEKYIRQSIQSVIDQTYTNWELIIVDDASTDSTPAIIEGFAKSDQRIRSVRHMTNRKLPAALNNGFARANGEFLTWTSDDNVYKPPALSTMVHFLQVHPDIGIVYSDFSLIDRNGNLKNSRRVKPPAQLLIGSVIGACFLYRRDVMETIGGYDPESFYAEDYDFWLRASNHFIFAPIHTDLYSYRVHESRLARDKDKIFQSTLRVKEKNIPKIKWADRQLMAIAYMHMANSANQLSNLHAALRYSLLAFFLSPTGAIKYLFKRTQISVKPSQ